MNTTGTIFSKVSTRHYYGDIVRVLFLLAAAGMLFLGPFFTDYLPVSIYVSLIVGLVLTLFSGITNPKLLWAALIDLLISLFGTFIYGYYAIDSFLKYSVRDFYFWINEILAVVFLLSLYFSTKTVRGFLLSEKNSSS